MVASSSFSKSLHAFIYGYTRLDLKNQSKKIYSIPYFPILGLLIVLVMTWSFLKSRNKKIEVDLDNFLTRRNEGVVISDIETVGILHANREDLPKKIGIAIDRGVIEHGITANHVFFLLNNNDLDIFTNEVLEIIGNKHVWIFTEYNKQLKYKKKLEKIGKTVFFNPKYLQRFGNNGVTLGLIARFLSLISRDSETNLDHVFHTIPDFCTISYSFPLDVHDSFASVLKHQKHFCEDRDEICIQICNYEDFIPDFTSSVKLVKAGTESFLIGQRFA
jgi:hypothetical protein